jgi:two-component system CheB/CheR fusion protein
MKPENNTKFQPDTVARLPEEQINNHETAGDHHGSWKYNLETGQLSLSPGARSLLGLPQGGNFQPWELLRSIDAKCAEKAKTWLRMAGQGGVLDQIYLKTDPGKGTARWIRVSGFHYAERWEKPRIIIGVLEDFTQDVDEERIALAIVNHELRTPLSVIKLKAQMIQKTGNPFTPVTHADMARSIEIQVENISRLLDQYLAGASGSAAPQLLNATTFDLNRLAAQILNDIKYLYPGHRFIYTGSGSVLINADKYQIMQVLINYLTNAAKYSPPGSEICLEVRTDRQQVVVKVMDHGCGIDAGLEKRVFDRFFRAVSTAGDSSSKGLGLYLVRQIIEQHHGTVWAKRGETNGTEFFFQLPLDAEVLKHKSSRQVINPTNSEGSFLQKTLA